MLNAVIGGKGFECNTKQKIPNLAALMSVVGLLIATLVPFHVYHLRPVEILKKECNIVEHSSIPDARILVLILNIVMSIIIYINTTAFLSDINSMRTKVRGHDPRCPDQTCSNMIMPLCTK